MRYISSRLLAVVFLFCSLICGAEEKGYVPDTGRYVNPRMKVLAEEDRGKYVCQLIEYSVDNSHVDCKGRKVKGSERIQGYLLLPDAARKGKCPAILMLHDHGARFDIGKEKLVRPIASVLSDGAEDHIMRSSEQWTYKYFDGVYLADSLAASGYVVLVSDALYWGSRSTEATQRLSELSYGGPSEVVMDKAARKKLSNRLKKQIYEGQRDVYDSLQNRGVIWAEKILRDDVAAARLLAGLSSVDENRVGAFGFSMGAHRCWLLAAFCDNVKYGVALSWMAALESYQAAHASDCSMRIQPMRDYMDFGDIGMYLAPKPMLFLNGDSDHLFSQEQVQIAFRKLHGHYSANPAVTEGILRTEFFEGGHYCGKSVQKTIVSFFDSYSK